MANAPSGSGSAARPDRPDRTGRGFESVSKWRMRFVMLLLLVLAAIILYRLVQITVVQHEAHEAFADRTWSIETKGPRGAILDRNGFPLATSIDAWEIHVDTRLWARTEFQPTEDSARLAELLRAPESVVLSLAAQTAADGGHSALIAYGLSNALGAQIHAEGLYGVQVSKTSVRRYVEGAMAAQVLGLVGRDEQGLAGLEYQYAHVLAGEAGLLVQEVDGLGRPIPFGPRAELSFQQGSSIVLTIDRNLQWLAEAALAEAVDEWSAIGGHIIMMDPRNGDILALASLPSYDPTTIDLNDPASMELLRSRAASDIYEPGSTFKTITMAAALDTGTVGPNTTFIDTGVAVVGNLPIHNFDYSYHGEQTMTQLMQRSLNTGTVWVAEQLGPDLLYDYIYRFGFGESTNSGLPGEVDGVVTDHSHITWSYLQMATNSFGQGIAVTPLQIVQAYSAIARGGVMVEPRLVSAVITDDGVEHFDPVIGERIISEDTAETLTWMLQAVVDGVLGHPAQAKGWGVAGKSGTSDIVEDGSYLEDTSIASFAGFAPADDPRVVVLVRIDRPQGEIYGGIVAAPVFGDLMKHALPYLGVPPTAYVADPADWITAPYGTVDTSGTYTPTDPAADTAAQPAVEEPAAAAVADEERKEEAEAEAEAAE